MSAKVGVLLSGCGFLDGSEIHEAVLTMLFLDRAGAELVCMAPTGAQAQVIDHATRKPAEGQSRDMLVESARIARGKIRDVAGVRAAELDAIVLPGGFGAAKNLCNFAVAGAKAVPHPQVAKLLRELHSQHKPIGAVCIAPALVASVLGKECAPVLTIGDDAGTAAAITAMGGVHRNCAVQGFCADDKNKIVSTPAYMFDARIGDVAAGIERLVQTLLGWCSKGKAAAGARA